MSEEIPVKVKLHGYRLRIPIQVDINVVDTITTRVFKRKKKIRSTLRYKAELERTILLEDRPNNDTIFDIPFLTLAKSFKLDFNKNCDDGKLAYYLKPERVVMNALGEAPTENTAENIGERRGEFVSLAIARGWAVNFFNSKKMRDYERIDDKW